MRRAKRRRTSYGPDDLEGLYTDGHIGHIAISGGFHNADLDRLRRSIIAAARAYLELIDEEIELHKVRKRQARQRERRRQKGLRFDVYDAETLSRRKPGRPSETSMYYFVSCLASIYYRQSGREPKGGSDRRPDDHFDEFLWAACNPLFDFKFKTHEHFVRWYERERKKMKEESGISR